MNSIPVKNWVIVLIFMGAFSRAYSQNSTDSIYHDGVWRSFIVHLPAGYSSANDYPLVYNFHGLGSTGEEQRIYTNFDFTADNNGFIAVYPNGVNNSWNIYTSSVDDVGFVDALTDTLLNRYSIDADRIYSTGMSNGGFFSYRLACEMPDRIAAIASVTGSMTTPMTSNCNTSRPVPILEIHGTADGIVPYGGTFGVEPIDTVIAYWVNKNNCPGISDTIPFPNTNTADNSTVDAITYSSCSSLTEVKLYKVYNGGHTWPGAIIDLPAGNTNHDINASQLIWEFFSKFTIQGNVSHVPALHPPAILLYPNPAQDHLIIESERTVQKDSKLIVTSANGQVISAINITQFPTTIGLKNWPSGLYFLRFVSADELSSGHSFILQR